MPSNYTLKPIFVASLSIYWRWLMIYMACKAVLRIFVSEELYYKYWVALVVQFLAIMLAVLWYHRKHRDLKNVTTSIGLIDASLEGSQDIVRRALSIFLYYMVSENILQGSAGMISKQAKTLVQFWDAVVALPCFFATLLMLYYRKDTRDDVTDTKSTATEI